MHQLGLPLLPQVTCSAADQAHSYFPCSLQPAKRTEREAEASDGGTRAPRRRPAGALGYALNALHDVLGADAPAPAAAQQRKRRLASDSEDASGAEEGERRQVQAQPPAAKRGAAAAGTQSKPHAVPAPAAEPAIPAPKSIDEIRKVRRQRLFA